MTAVSKAIIGDMTYIQTLRYVGNAGELIAVQTPIKTANNLHPLVKVCLEDPCNHALSEFAHTFVGCITDLIGSENQDRSLEKPDRWMKMTAHRYFAVDWTKYKDTQLKPPYKIWLRKDGIVEITEDHLTEWYHS